MVERGSGRRLGRRLLIAAVALFALFVVGGYVVAPPILKARILREMSKRLGREVAVGTVRVNPFELSTRIHDLTILDRDGAVFASWKEAYVNYRFTSFLSRHFRFDELSFREPYARLVIERDGALNVDDLLKIFRAAPAPSAGPPPVWSFERVAVEGARVQFADRMREPVFESTLGPFRLELDRFSTSPASESPYSFRGSTESGESFAWTGRITTDPLRSNGQLSLENVRLPKYKPYYETGRPFQVRDGRVSVSGEYDFAWTPDERRILVRGGRLELADAKIARPGTEAPDIEVERLTIEGADVDGLARSASIARIALDGGHVLIRHDRQGVNLYEMIRPFVEPPPHAAAAEPSPAAPGPSPRLKVGELSVARVVVDAEDLVPKRPFRVRAHEVSFRMTGIDNEPTTRSPVSLSARFEESGLVRADGTFSADFHRGDLDVQVEEVDIRATDTYVDPVAEVRITSGRVGAKGHVTYEMPPRGALEFRYEGDLAVRDLAVVHAETASELSRVAVVKASPLDVRLNPMRIAIGEIAIGAPRLTVEAAPDRSINLAQAIVRSGDPGPADPGRARELPEVTIGAVRIRNGGIHLTDRSIDPAVVTSLSKIEGTVKGISSKELARADVDIEALLDGVAPVAMTGQINPIARKDFTDLTVAVRGIDLLPFSPYAGKYLGWTLAKGKMAADLKYKISERRFTSENVFTIDQMELGTKTESPDAVKVPLKLAVAVLRDRSGQIVLDVPAEGSVDDPEFRLGRVIVRAIVNVLTKIVTSPFRLLAHAFGGQDQEIDFQVFSPGSSELADAERAKLDVVARSLTERPELALDVMGSFEPDADAEALRKARLDDLVRTQKWKVVSASDPARSDPSAVTVPVEEYARWLAAAYAAAVPAPPSPPPAPPTTVEMEAALLGSIEILPDDLRQLAAARARNVRDYITTTGGVAPDRVFLAGAVEREGRAPAPRVWLELR